MRYLTAILPLILCAAMNGGGAHSVVDGKVWGDNRYRQLCVTGGSLRPYDTQTHPVQVAAGQFHTLVLWDDGTLTTCGRNDFGQLGNSTPRMRNALVLSEVSLIGDGANHSLAVVAGQLVGWGDNRSGQLCMEASGQPVYSPVAIALDNVTSMDGGDHHSIFLADGVVYTCGSNDFGQLGNGLRADAVAAGGEHSLALVGGRLWSTGKNAFGQLCLDDTVQRSEWTDTGISGVAKVSAEGPFTALLMEDGSVRTCGRAMFYNRVFPGPYVDIAAGHYHLLMKAADGSVWAFGRNNAGQVGDGTTVNRSDPVRVW